MHKGYRVVALVPAGRERYLRILIPYILSSELVDECHLWENTNNPDDIAFIRRMGERFAKIKVVPPPDAPQDTHHVGRFYRLAVEPETIYIKLDDDIVHIPSDFFKKILDIRLRDRESFWISPNIVNNNLCTFIMQTLGILPDKLVGPSCMDERGWMGSDVAEFLHKLYLKQARAGALAALRFGPRVVALARHSINCIVWFGSDFAAFGGVLPPGEDDEEWLSITKPLELGRVCRIHGATCLAHFAFFTQRERLDASGLLDEYALLCRRELPDLDFSLLA